MDDFYTKAETDKKHEEMLFTMTQQMEHMKNELDRNLNNKVSKLATVEQAEQIMEQNEQILKVFGAVARAGRIAEKGGILGYRGIIALAAFLVAGAVIFGFFKGGFSALEHNVSDLAPK